MLLKLQFKNEFTNLEVFSLLSMTNRGVVGFI